MGKDIDLLLINAKSRDVLPSYLPYGLLWIAGVLRENNLEVRIYDRNVSREKLGQVLKKYDPKMAGVSCLTGPVIDDAIMISKLIRKELKDTPIIWGGLHPTIFPNHVLVKEYVDYIIRGEGEYPLLELSKYLLKGEGNLEDIDNLGFKENGKIKLNKERDFIDLNELPLPAWDLVDMKRYYQNKFYANRVITLNTSRGCPWRCSFCYNQAVNKGRWRGIKAEKIIEHIDFLRSRYGIKRFQIYDDDFDANKRRLVEFCNLLLEENRDIAWQHFSRVNYAREDILRLEKAAGCKFIEYGVESGSQRILDFIQKGQTVSMTKKAFAICRKVGIPTSALFMVGLPTETTEDVNKTISLVRSLDAHQTINTIYRPYPATELYIYCARAGLFKLPDDLEEQGKIYGLGDTEINVSRVPANYLQRIQSNFAFNNVKNEIRFCIRHNNWRLLFYYCKNRLSYRGIKWILQGFSGYLKLKFKRGVQ